MSSWSQQWSGVLLVAINVVSIFVIILAILTLHHHL
jgi:hypothetical protein